MSAGQPALGAGLLRLRRGEAAKRAMPGEGAR